MALESTPNITRPGQDGGTGAIDALHIAEYTGVVHETIARRSVLEPWVPTRPVKGTSVLQSYAVGESTLAKVTPGTTPDGTINKAGKNTLTVDTVILARSFFPLLETWQDNKDMRTKVGREHGKKHAKFKDQAFFIQAIKAGLLSASKYAGVDGAGYGGGNQVTLNSLSDASDPARLYSYLVDLLVKFEKRDVDPVADELMIVVRPDEFAILEQNELLIDRTLTTSEGNSVQARVLKARGVPVISTNNAPFQSTITDHLLSNSDNSNAYDGDFSKVVASVFSAQALLAGETIPMTTNVWWDQKALQWTVDAYVSFGVTPDLGDYAGVLLAP